MKNLQIVVLAKQVPDTRNVGKDAMKADGTVNRAALPAIFNPEDLNALEQALRLKDRFPGTRITLLTMGPGRAAEIIREGLYRGADDGILLTDRAFAGADTLATSYALSCAIRKMHNYHLIFAGRQAIDGDTAQVGPQVAEKLSLPQVTYVEEILDFTGDRIIMKRRLERGIEIVDAPVPCVLTVNGSAPGCRPRNVRAVMKYKHARTTTERQNSSEDYIDLYQERPYLDIPEWGAADLDIDVNQIGLSGSPTKVKKIENIIFQARETRRISPDDDSINALMKELIGNHTLG